MTTELHVLLADDDMDDRFFFDLALQETSFPTKLTALEDGEKLMAYLTANTSNLPQVLFLDMNMPRKNGSECLEEIKHSATLKDLPVIIYSTSLHDDVADLLYKNGAHYYIRKTSIENLEKTLDHIFTLMKEGKFTRPTRENFILSMVAV